MISSLWLDCFQGDSFAVTIQDLGDAGLTSDTLISDVTYILASYNLTSHFPLKLEVAFLVETVRCRTWL